VGRGARGKVTGGGRTDRTDQTKKKLESRSRVRPAREKRTELENRPQRGMEAGQSNENSGAKRRRNSSRRIERDEIGWATRIEWGDQN